jgi:hypothetical protein
VGAKIGPLIFLKVPKKEKVALKKATFLTINALNGGLTPFPLPLYPCSKVFLRASVHGGKGEPHQWLGR